MPYISEIFPRNQFLKLHLYFLGGIVLDRSMPPQNIPPMRGEEKKVSKIEDNQFAFSPDNLDTSSPEFLDAMGAKAHLIIRMLENR